MLKYKVSPNKEIHLNDFPISELYVSPDLLYISGYTDYNTGLVDGESVMIDSPYLLDTDKSTINVKNIKIQGRLGVKIELPVKTITTNLKLPIYSDENGSYILVYNKRRAVTESGDYVICGITQNYVEYNGDISYFFDGNPSGYLINHSFYAANEDDSKVTINTFLNIEDGKLTVGDYVYDVDFSNEKPIIRLSKNHSPIVGGDLLGLINGCKVFASNGDVNSLSVYDYLPSQWKRMQKFAIIKEEDTLIEVDAVMYGGYKHYVEYNGKNYDLKEVYDNDNNYVGYGVVINDKFYEATNNYGNDSVYEQHHDLEYNGSAIYIPEDDIYLDIEDTLISQTNDGCFLIIIDSSDNFDMKEGYHIIAESSSPIETIEYVKEENGKYVTYQGKRYNVEDHLYDTVTMSDNSYVLTYLNDNYTSASTVVNGETMYFDITGSKAVLTNKVYYEASTNKVEYGKNTNGYNITNTSGVTIDGIKYPVIVDDNGEYVILNEMVSFNLVVTSIDGSSSYIVYPDIDNDTIDDVEMDELRRETCGFIVNNWKSFRFKLRYDTFGNKLLSVENGLMNSMSSSVPYSILDFYALERNIKIYRVTDYISFNFPLFNKSANNISRDDVVTNDFVGYARENSINKIVDMEKDVYYPVWKEGNKFNPIRELQFNLHFRTRNLDNWKVIDDDTDKDNSNWFVTDYSYYKNVKEDETCGTIATISLHSASDLLGLANFTTDDVKSVANNLKKTFLRLSFYSTPNPKTQVLLCTSTVFFDANYAYKKYIDNVYRQDYTNVINSDSRDESISAFGEPSDVLNSEEHICAFTDERRLSSRFVIKDKYSTDTSSEGYYMYMFKEYAKKLHEATIYLKVEFNHAGIGKTIQFALPRKSTESDPLYLFNANDVEMLKSGFTMSDIYNQTHIPIKIIYDKEADKYVYYLPDGLRENTALDIDNDIMIFNLFEIKFADESTFISGGKGPM